MESQSATIEFTGEQTQSNLLRESCFSTAPQSVPSDQRLWELLNQSPPSPPFTLIDNFLVLKEKPPHAHPSYQIHKKILTYNRKEKSLEELTKKFINLFQGQNKQLLELDKVTTELKVERRRIYDVINILESLKVVLKKGKNCYQWRGLEEGLEMIRQCEQNPNSLEVKSLKKEKSLEYLANTFLKIMIKRNTISLEEAAKELINDVDEEFLKTKIRRLYDIVNVFKSLNLVRKISLGTKKPGFKWLGMQGLAKYINSINFCPQSSSNQIHRPISSTHNEENDFLPQNSPGFFLSFLSRNTGCMDLSTVAQTIVQGLFVQRGNSTPETPILHKTYSTELEVTEEKEDKHLQKMGFNPY